jgi:hypothetical protein
MADERDDEQGPIEPEPLELSAFALNADDGLQVDASDLDPTAAPAVTPRAERKPARAEAFNPAASSPMADQALFNALVSPKAPVTLQRSRAATTPPSTPTTTAATTPARVAEPIAPTHAIEETVAEVAPVVADEADVADVVAEVEAVVAGEVESVESFEEMALEAPVVDESGVEEVAEEDVVAETSDEVAEVPVIDTPAPAKAPAARVEAPFMRLVMPDDELSAEAPDVALEAIADDVQALVAEPAFALASLPAAESDATEEEWTESTDDEEPSLQIAGGSDDVRPRGRTGAWWTIPLMCAGIAIAACAVLVPAADENRRAMHELAKLEQEVTYFDQQSDVNQQFLQHVSTDPTLAERLAMRQLRLTRPTARIVQMPHKDDPFSMSPYALVSIDPPAPLPEYRSMGGMLGEWFLDAKRQTYLAGLGLLLTAAGVIFGGGTSRDRTPLEPEPEPAAA